MSEELFNNKKLFRQNNGTHLVHDFDVLRDQNIASLFRHELRQKIESRDIASNEQAGCEVTSNKISGELMETVCDAMEEILQSSVIQKRTLDDLLGRVFTKFRHIYENSAIAETLRKRQYICGSGLVMSPENCTTSIKDGLRIRAFVRGIDKAIKHLRRSRKDPLHIVYPACGPFAPFLLPLLSYYRNRGLYRPTDINVTLIDIQPGAVQSVNALVSALGIGEYISDTICCDALSYQASRKVDMVVLEAMQHGFSREGHLAIAAHFATLLSEDGIFIPKDIVIHAALAVGQREYVDQWKGEKLSHDQQKRCQEIQQERVQLGNILRVNVATLRDFKFKVQVHDEHTSLLECVTITIPELPRDRDKYIVILCSEVNVFDDDNIGEYESGITHPLPDLQVCVNFTPLDHRQGDVLITSGEQITFYYCMNGLPGFMPVKVHQETCGLSGRHNLKQHGSVPCSPDV